MVHPGPKAAERAVAVRTSLHPVTGLLRRGESVMQAVGDLFASHGCKGGVLYFDGVPCDPIRFVLPAPATDGLHAAWYSATHAPEGPWVMTSGTASVGWRDGAPFLHCHGLWQPEDGPGTMGHLLPHETRLAADVRVHGLGSRDAWFEGLPDPETAFTLFTPAGGGPGGALVARILPGEDVVTAIETLAAAHGIVAARLHGVGSIDHVTFAEGHRMECLATELRFSDAWLRGGQAEIDIEVVDIDANIMRGRLTRGANPVGVTLELIIEPVKDIP